MIRFWLFKRPSFLFYARAHQIHRTHVRSMWSLPGMRAADEWHFAHAVDHGACNLHEVGDEVSQSQYVQYGFLTFSRILFISRFSSYILSIRFFHGIPHTATNFFNMTGTCESCELSLLWSFSCCKSMSRPDGAAGSALGHFGKDIWNRNLPVSWQHYSEL